MTKKVLKDEELENVSGGGGFDRREAQTLSGKISPQEAYQRVGQNFFLESPGNTQGRIYATLNSCYEDDILWWSYTHYRMTIISVNWHASYEYSPGEEIDVVSKRYALYTNCSGYTF